MRDLTEEELKLAPDWATHYYAFDNGAIQFESEYLYARVSAATGILGCEQCNKDYGISGVPIPFDITKHEFSDDFTYFDFESRIVEGVVIVDGGINKDDVVAIARALGVTGDDLKAAN